MMSILLLLFAFSIAHIPLARSLPFSVNRSTVYLQYAYAAFCPSERLLNWDCEWCVDKEVRGPHIRYAVVVIILIIIISNIITSIDY